MFWWGMLADGGFSNDRHKHKCSLPTPPLQAQGQGQPLLVVAGWSSRGGAELKSSRLLALAASHHRSFFSCLALASFSSPCTHAALLYTQTMPSTTSSSSSSLPWLPIRIDLSPFLPSSSSSSSSSSSTSTSSSTEAKQATVLALRHACETDGLFLLDCKGWTREGRREEVPDTQRKMEKSASDDDTQSMSSSLASTSPPPPPPPVLDAISSFFALSLDQKEALPSIHSQGLSRGYIPVLGESGLKAQYCEWKEGFSLGYEAEEEEEGEEKVGREKGVGGITDGLRTEGKKKQQQQPSNPLEGSNVWPTSPTALRALRGGRGGRGGGGGGRGGGGREEGGGGGGEGWKKELVTFYRDLVVLSQALTRALSLALGQEEGWLEGVCGKGGEKISLLRAFHYFPSSSLPPSIAPSRAVGSSPHTDWGLLTIILEERGREGGGEGGLQIRRRRGEGGREGGKEGGKEEEYEWVGVRAVSGTLVVNCGDFLALLSRRVLGGREGGREGGEEGEREEGEVRRPFHSPVHRVMLSREQHRTSLVFFYYPSFDTPLEEGGREGGRDGGAEGGEAYNTLLQVEKEEEGGRGGGGEGGRMVVTFGEHIMRKWAGVKSS